MVKTCKEIDVKKYPYNNLYGWNYKSIKHNFNIMLNPYVVIDQINNSLIH